MQIQLRSICTGYFQRFGDHAAMPPLRKTSRKEWNHSLRPPLRYSFRLKLELRLQAELGVYLKSPGSLERDLGVAELQQPKVGFVVFSLETSEHFPKLVQPRTGDIHASTTRSAFHPPIVKEGPHLAFR
jgi:hypothetical protein